MGNGVSRHGSRLDPIFGHYAIAAADNYGLGLSIIPPQELEPQGLTVDAPLVFMSGERLKYCNLLFLVEPGTSIGYSDSISMRTKPLILASLRRVT